MAGKKAINECEAEKRVIYSTIAGIFNVVAAAEDEEEEDLFIILNRGGHTLHSPIALIDLENDPMCLPLFIYTNFSGLHNGAARAVASATFGLSLLLLARRTGIICCLLLVILQFPMALAFCCSFRAFVSWSPIIIITR